MHLFLGKAEMESIENFQTPGSKPQPTHERRARASQNPEPSMIFWKYQLSQQLARVWRGGQSVRGYHFKQFGTEAVEFAGADARNMPQTVDRLGPIAGNLGERCVVEDHVGRYAVALRGFRAPCAQA